eukprot:8928082-Pyramimonas_sp.AAC.1
MEALAETQQHPVIYLLHELATTQVISNIASHWPQIPNFSSLPSDVKRLHHWPLTRMFCSNSGQNGRLRCNLVRGSHWHSGGSSVPAYQRRWDRIKKYIAGHVATSVVDCACM